VWKEAVIEEAKKDYNFDISEMSLERSMSILLVHYPLALKTGENSYKIRGVSWVTKEGGLVFMCGVAESSEFYVMKCTNKELINAAKNGAKIALDNLGAKPAGALIANCVSRGAILDKEFIREVDEIRKTVSAPLLGFEAMGEICMAPGQFSGFHNATIVTLVLPE